MDIQTAGRPKARQPLAFKIGVSAFAVVTLTVALVLGVEYQQQERDIEESSGQSLVHIAATAAVFLDGDLQEAIHSNDDVDSPSYQKLKALLVRVQQENQLNDYDVYTLRQSGEGFEFVMGLRPTPMVETPYDPPAEILPVLKRAQAGKAGATPVYRDNFGSFVSAFAPLRNRSGRVVGLLEIDNDVSVLLQRLRSRLGTQALIGVLALALALLLSFIVARSLTRSVASLITAIGEVEAGKYDVQVTVRTRDEIGVLAQVFNSMLRGLRERLAMLRFVPRHTRAVIAAAVRDHAASGDAFLARKRELAVLFSDIRGFTSMSDELSPDRVIAMLNTYLRQESEIVENHAGSVDKFIGDAVMAIFDGPDRFADAASAALDIQAAMAKLNAAKAFERPVEVGIGIAGGEVVMGSVGSEERTELAIIGRLTNLASRLTSVAGRGEVLISEYGFQALGGRFEGERREGLHLKGFAQEQTCYRLVRRLDGDSPLGPAKSSAA